MSVLDDLLAANERYAASFAKGDLPVPPARRVAVLTCMDARLDPERFLGLSEGDAHVIRNAGGRASDDAIRSLVISYKLLGTREFLVIHHEECGMLTFTNEQLREQLRRDLNADASGVDFLPFSDLDESVREDVETIRSSPLVAEDISVSGFVYDVKSGRLREVE
jgi:carbonic anhydrase